MNFSNNPQSVYNGMMSAHRNMFLMSSVAIAMVGFVNKYNSVMITIASSFIFLVAAYIGINANLDFEHYLENNDFPKHKYRFGTRWHYWKYMGYTYAFFLVLLTVYSLYILSTRRTLI